MLDYLISLLNFTVNGNTYNLITSPWSYMIEWISRYNSYSTSQVPSTAVRDAYYDLMKIGFMYSILVIVLVILCSWFVYKVASGFTGWMKFR